MGEGGCRSEGQAKGSFYSTSSHPQYSVSETSDGYNASARHSSAFPPSREANAKLERGCFH